jgi:hypothetical protein
MIVSIFDHLQVKARRHGERDLAVDRRLVASIETLELGRPDLPMR